MSAPELARLAGAAAAAAAAAALLGPASFEVVDGALFVVLLRLALARGVTGLAPLYVPAAAAAAAAALRAGLASGAWPAAPAVVLELLRYGFLGLVLALAQALTARRSLGRRAWTCSVAGASAFALAEGLRLLVGVAGTSVPGGSRVVAATLVGLMAGLACAGRTSGSGQ